MTEIVEESTGMNPKIKERIEQIHQGIVPEGYKKTRVGIIPEEWDVKALGDIAEVVSGGTPKTTIDEYWNGTVMWATPTDITSSKKYISNTERTITELGLEKSSAKLLPRNSILMTSRATIGERAINKVPMATNQGFKSLVPNKHTNYEYLYYLLAIYKRDLYNLANGSTFLEVATRDVQRLRVYYPPLKEQQQIAEILSTWDRAIELKETLIQEKVDMKTGLKQRLIKDSEKITTEVRLKDILDYKQPDKYIAEEIKEEGKIPVLTANKSFIVGYTNENEGIYNNSPVIIFDDFTTDIKYVDFPFKIRSSAIKILYKKSDKINLRYIFELLTLVRFPTGGHKRHYISEYQFIKVPVPSIEEQREVVSILSSLDKKISLLKQELSLLKEQKKGLMQLLLTGIVRVGEVEELE